MSTSNISLPSLSSAPLCDSICANAPEFSPRKNRPSRISLPLTDSGVVVRTSPVKSVRNPSVFIKNLDKSTSKMGNDVNPDPRSVIVILVITPASATAVPKAPTPPPPEIRTDTKVYPVPPLTIATEFNL